MGAFNTRLKREHKKEEASKNKTNGGKRVIVRKGSLSQSSKTSTENSRRGPFKCNKNRQGKPSTEIFTNNNRPTDETTQGSVVVMTKDKEYPVKDLASTQPNDLQSGKKVKVKTKKNTGTQCSQIERPPLNNISSKAENISDCGKIAKNNIQQRVNRLQACQRSDKGSIRRRRSSRKFKRHLFPSPAVFSHIDAHAIRAGEELRKKQIFSVKDITQAITTVAKTDLQKVRAIWIWLCHCIEYDVRGLGLTKKMTSPEHVIKHVIETGCGVCWEYALMCKQMCSEVGIECLEVGGHSKGSSYRPGLQFQATKSDHMWNAVRLQGHWYLLDSCWGAGTVDGTKRVFNKCYNEFYFLTDPDMFISDHFPDEVEWQLLKVPITLDEFQRRVQKTSRFFQLGLTLQHPTYFHMVTENGEATIVMTFPEPLEFTYEFSQRTGSIQSELSSSAAFLVVTTTHMRLRLRPPTQGVFDVIVFARTANTSGDLEDVCNFLLECPNPSLLDAFPENPSKSWGLRPKAKSLGLKPCQYEAEIKVESGDFEMLFQTTRPLMMLCELSHKDLDEALANRCVASQSKPSQLRCHILFPYVGYYQLAVYVKDSDSTSKSYSPAGNFLLHCTRNPEISPLDLFPENPSKFWGLDPNAKSLGLKPCGYEAEFELTSSKFEMVFQTTRPLMMLCELSHKDLDKVRAERCVATQCKPDQLKCHILFPYVGYYRLAVYVKESDSSQSCRLAANFLLRCSSSAVISINKLFPPELSSNCGPGNATLKAGLTDFSHTGALINTKQGKCKITFRNQHGLKLQADLSRLELKQAKYPLSRYVLLSCVDNHVTIKVSLPEEGLYLLSLYGGPATTTSSPFICDFVLHNDWNGVRPPFPISYVTWQDGCVLIEPLTGQLEPMSKVRFCVKVPRAKEVCVINGRNRTELHLKQWSQEWEGEVFTGSGPQLKLAASFPEGTPGKLTILLCFDVLTTPSGLKQGSPALPSLTSVYKYNRKTQRAN